MKKLLIFISMLALFLLVVSCAPKMSEEELQAELAKLTPEEREELLADLEAKESGALAGQAVKAKYVGKVSAKLLTVKPALVRQAITTLPTPTANVCGDGNKAATEQCDDGNNVDGDGCNADCRLEQPVTTPTPGQGPTAGPPTTCEDSDADSNHADGKDYYDKGTITGTGVPAGGRDDACVVEGGDDLRENYCSSIPNGLHQEITVKCSQYGPKDFGTTGWKCYDGACTDKKPDLVVNSAEFLTFVNASGKYANITAKVQNIGPVSTGGDFHTLFKEAPFVIQFKPSGTLAAGAEVTLSDVHASCPTSFTLNIMADDSTVAAYQNKIAESDETNNGKQLTVTC